MSGPARARPAWRRGAGARALRRLGLALSVGLVAVWILGPFAWLFVTSVSHQKHLLARPMRLIPPEVTFSHYQAILGFRSWYAQAQTEKIFPALVNSAVVALSVTAINLVLGTGAGYAFARYRFPLKRTTLVAILFTRMLPTLVLLPPFFLIFRQLGLVNTRLALIIIYNAFTLPFTIWIMKGYFETVPRELERSAYVDGCTRLQALWRIVLPVSLPGVMAAGAFTFMLAWNEFLLAQVLTKTNDSITLPPVIQGLWGQVYVDYTSIAAAGVLSAVPAVVLVLAFQRYMVQGLIKGSLKG